MFTNMSTQSILSGISYGIIYLLYLFKMRLNTTMMVIGLLIGLGLSALVAYDINCLTTGQCTIWSWIRTLGLVLMSLLLFTISTRM